MQNPLNAVVQPLSPPFHRFEECLNALRQPGKTLFNILRKDPFPVAGAIWLYLQDNLGPVMPFFLTNFLYLAKELQVIEMRHVGPRKQQEPVEEGVWLLEDTVPLEGAARLGIAALRQGFATMFTMLKESLKEFYPEKFSEFVTLALDADKMRTSGDLRRLTELFEAVKRCALYWGIQK
jgi:hypothetical protein